MILTKHINRWYRENQRSEADDAGAIHPSSLGDCNRLTVYKYLGLPKDIKEHSPEKQAMFFQGYAIEDVMSDALKAEGLLIAKSVPVSAELGGVQVKGTIDQIVRWPPEDLYNGWAIADTKSVKDSAFRYLPYLHHVIQVGAYQWILRQMLKKKRDDSGWLGWLARGCHGEEQPPLLFYIGRGSLREGPPISAGTEAAHAAVAKMTEVIEYITSDAIPDRPFDTPEEHPYLCATHSRGGYKRKDGTYKEGREPTCKPNCEYFKTCWGKMPEEWPGGAWRTL